MEGSKYSSILFIWLLCYSSCCLSLKIKNVKIYSCAKPNSIVKFGSIKLVDSSVTFPGKVDLTIMDSKVSNKTIKSPLSVAVNFQRQLLIPDLKTGKGKWIKVPCISDKYGSCTFKDICPKLSELDKQQKPCPLPLLTALGLSCTCPIVVKDGIRSSKRKEVSFQTRSWTFPLASIGPSKNFKLNINAWTGNTPVMCINSTSTVY